MCNKTKGNAKTLLQFTKFVLHFCTQLQIKADKVLQNNKVSHAVH